MQAENGYPFSQTGLYASLLPVGHSSVFSPGFDNSQRLHRQLRCFSLGPRRKTNANHSTQHFIILQFSLIPLGAKRKTNANRSTQHFIVLQFSLIPLGVERKTNANRSTQHFIILQFSCRKENQSFANFLPCSPIFFQLDRLNEARLRLLRFLGQLLTPEPWGGGSEHVNRLDPKEPNFGI